jgi:hypothetical protein
MHWWQIEGQKAGQQQAQQEKQALGRLEKIRADQVGQSPLKHLFLAKHKHFLFLLFVPNLVCW